jgi:hypothetical protein
VLLSTGQRDSEELTESSLAQQRHEPAPQVDVAVIIPESRNPFKASSDRSSDPTCAFGSRRRSPDDSSATLPLPDYVRVARHLATILRWDLVSISPRALETLDPRALPYNRPAVSHIGLTKWDWFRRITLP